MVRIEKEYLTEYDSCYDSCFSDGGESYSHDELSEIIMNEAGVDQKTSNVIIEGWLDRGFIYDCGNNCYVR